MEALARGNAVRSERARFKTSLRRLSQEKAMRKSIALIERPPEWAQTWQVRGLLLELPKVGRVKADKLLLCARISQTKTLGGLTSRQRGELVELLAG
jgi:hypothetical protein